MPLPTEGVKELSLFMELEDEVRSNSFMLSRASSMEGLRVEMDGEERKENKNKMPHGVIESVNIHTSKSETTNPFTSLQHLQPMNHQSSLISK